MTLPRARFHAALRSAVGVVAATMVLALAGCEVGVERQSDSAASAPPTTDEGQSRMAPLAPPANPRIARGRLNFVEGYRTGLAQAAAESKPMLLFFSAQWCHYCHQMADESFTHPQVVALSERFVCVLIDADVEGDVCQQFQVTGFPTIQLLSSRGQPLGRLVGKKPGHELMMAMQAALQSVAWRDDVQEEPSPR